MPNNDLPTRYKVAWKKLYELVERRNELLEEFEEVIAPAMNLTPRTRLVAEVDTAWARVLLDRVDGMAPQIDEAMTKANRLGQRIGKPGIRWAKTVLPKR